MTTTLTNDQITAGAADEYAENLHLMHVAPSPQVADIAELPPLPEPKYCADDLADIFTVDQMQQYARDAIAASRRSAGGEVRDQALEEAAAACDEFNMSGMAADIRALKSAAPASAGKAAQTLPVGWVPLSIVYNDDMQHPEEVAYGPPHMMNRLGKWLDKFMAREIAERGAQPAEGAGQAGQVACKNEKCEGGRHYNTEHTRSWPCPTCSNERAAAPAEHKRVIEFALELAEHENHHAVVSFLKAWNSEDEGYLRANWPDFATHQPSAQKGGEA